MSPLLKVSLKYALFGAILAIALIVVLFFSNRHPLLIPIVYDYRIFLFALFIFFGLKEFRDYHNNGILHFWQGMAAGTLIYLIVGMLGGVFIMIFGQIQDNFLSIYIAEATNQLTDHKDEFLETIGEITYNNTLRELPLTTVTDLAIDYFLKCMPIGLFLTIIISVILRRQPKS